MVPSTDVVTSDATPPLDPSAAAGALAELRAEDRERPFGPDDLDHLARTAYRAGELEAAIGAWERAHAVLVASGDHLEAGGVAATIAMYLMMDTGLMAPVRGWIARAERLVEDTEEGPVHAVLAMTGTYERIMSGDLATARKLADRAVELGERHAEPAAAAIGRVAQARLRILEGDVEEGLRMLDEAAVATVTGELDDLATGMVYCELICAMQGLAQYDRAEEWTEAMEGWRHGAAYGGINGRCRVHRAEMLRLRGDCEHAEEEALLACDELRPWMRREFGWPLTELGNIRLRKGDLVGADAAFLAAHANGWDPQPGLALTRLAQGDAVTAGEMLADALEHPTSIPSKERPPTGELRRAPLLAADVEVAVALGDRPRAARGAEELERISRTFRSRALEAAAHQAAARVSLVSGRTEDAEAYSRRAIAAWSEVGAPFEVAVARMDAATAYERSGRTGLARLERVTAAAEFARLGARLQHDQAMALMSGEPEPRPTVAGRPAAEAVFQLDGDVRVMTFAGRTVTVRDLKGMRYLARLLEHPGRELHVLDLVGVATDARSTVGLARAEGLTVAEGAGLGPQLDDEARDAYRRRLREIEEDIDEADACGDAERAALAAADRDFLVRELASAFGLHGRHRAVGSSSERARTSVTRTIRYAMARIEEHHEELGEHLLRTVVTGTYCRYDPDPALGLTWKV